MCQGVVISLVTFKSNGKRKRIVLFGIGSHSGLVKDNITKLKRAGWKEGGEEGVISIESDFSTWNKYSVQCGTLTESERKILDRAYKSVAGNAKSLIAHVGRCGRIDDALLRLLTDSALSEYEKVKASAWSEYEKVRDLALSEYEKVKASALSEYKKVTDSAWSEYEKVRASAWSEYEKVTDSALSEYKKVTDSALSEYEKVTDSAWSEYEKVKASAWIKIFCKRENRIECLQ